MLPITASHGGCVINRTSEQECEKMYIS